MNQGHIPFAQLGPVPQITKQITANVYVEDQYSAVPSFRGSNHSIVTTSEGVVMIDSPMMPTDAIKWRFGIEKIRWKKKVGEVRYIINTDSHPDHITGNSVFSPPAVVVSTQGVRETFPDILSEDAITEIREVDPGDVHLLEFFKLRPPAITYTEKLTLYLGEHTFQCYSLPGHTSHHGGVYVPEEKVFFAGDNFTYNTQPALYAGNLLDWVESLKFIESLDIDWVVGGHGPVAPKSAISEFGRFLQTCIDQTRNALAKGWTKEETVEKLDWEHLTLGSIHQGKETQRRNVAKLYDVLAQER